MVNQTEQKPPLQAGVRAIGLELKPYKRQLWVLIALGLVSAVANGTVPYITGKFFDALISLSQGKTLIFSGVALWAVLLGLWAFIQLLANNIDWVSDRLSRGISTKLQLGIQTHGFLHLVRLPIDFHKNEHISAILQRFSSASWRVSNIMTNIV
jgi:ABC-type multidrug transport system fused ATPase/permease subunit